MSSSQKDIVDVWAQLPLIDFKDLPEVDPLFRKSKSPVYEWNKTYKGPPPISVTVDGMDAAGVDKLMLCGWNRPGKVLISNEQILEYTTAYPDRFTGIVSVDILNPVKASQDIDYYVKKHKFGECLEHWGKLSAILDLMYPATDNENFQLHDNPTEFKRLQYAMR